MVIVSPSNVTMRFRSSGDMPKARTHDTGMDIDVPIAFFPAFPPVFLNMILRCLSSMIFFPLNNLYVSRQIYHDQELHHSQTVNSLTSLPGLPGLPGLPAYQAYQAYQAGLSRSETASLSNFPLVQIRNKRGLSLSETTSLLNSVNTDTTTLIGLSLSETTSLSNILLYNDG